MYIYNQVNHTADEFYFKYIYDVPKNNSIKAQTYLGLTSDELWFHENVSLIITGNITHDLGKELITKGILPGDYVNEIKAVYQKSNISSLNVRSIANKYGIAIKYKIQSVEFQETYKYSSSGVLLYSDWRALRDNIWVYITYEIQPELSTIEGANEDPDHKSLTISPWVWVGIAGIAIVFVTVMIILKRRSSSEDLAPGNEYVIELEKQSDETKYCYSCGSLYPKNLRKCPKCGKS